MSRLLEAYYINIQGREKEMSYDALKLKKAIIYGRKSRDDQQSLEGQIQECIDWCLKNGITDYKIFKDEGNASSEDWDREGLQNMLAEIQDPADGNLYDVVVTVEQFRICRTDDFPKFREILVDTGVFFAQTESDKLYNYTREEDVLISGIMQELGKFFLAQTKKKLKRGMIQSAKRGNYVGKKAPAGYDYDPDTKKLVKNKYAPIMRELFEMYLAGMSTQEIAYSMTHDNIEIPYKVKGVEKFMNWSSANLSRILNNKVYAGFSIYGKTTQGKNRKTKKRETIKNDVSKQIIRKTHEGIVTLEEWDRIQAIKLKRNSRPISLKLAKHTFSGFIRCGICGSTHSFQTNNKNGKKRITSCQTRTYSEDLITYKLCKTSGSNLEDFNQLFYAAFGRKIQKLNDHVDLIKSAEVSNDQRAENKKELIKKKEKMITQLTTTVNNIQRGFELGIYEGQELEKANEIKKLKSNIKIHENEIEEIKAEKANNEADHLGEILTNMNRFVTGKDNPNIDEREMNEILSEFIETILYRKENGEITIDIIWKAELKEI